MKRVALIIGASADPSTGLEPLPGVKADLNTYARYLSSPYGGAWDEGDEFIILKNAKRKTIEEAISYLAAKKPDYSFVSFSGHGGAISENKDFICTYDGIRMDSESLFISAPRKALIIDACRVPETEPLHEATQMIAGIEHFGSYEARLISKKLFFEALESSNIPYIKINSCSYKEEAKESSNRGGLFTRSFISVACRLASGNSGKAFSIFDVFTRTDKIVVTDSNGEQHPEYMKSRVMGNSYPFAIGMAGLN